MEISHTKTTSYWDQIYLTCLIFFLVFSHFSISLTQIFGLTGAGIWLVHICMGQNWRKINWPLAGPLSAFFLACLIASARAVDPWVSLATTHKVLLAIIFFWVVNVIAHLNPREFFLWRNLFKGSTKTNNSFSRWITATIPREPIPFFATVLILASVLASIFSLYSATELNSYPVWRNPGTLADILSFSTLVMMTSIIVLSRILFQSKSNFWLYLALVVLISALLATLSRQTWVGLIISVLVLLYFKKRALVMVAPILIIFVLMAAPQTITDRMASIFDLEYHSNKERILLWKAGWQIFKDHPYTGCGFSCLAGISGYEADHPILKDYQHLHNNFLQIAVDTGMLGLLSWCFIWAAYFRFLFKNYNKTGRNQPGRWVFLGSLNVVLGFLAAGFFENSFYDSEISMLLYFIMALPFALDSGPMPAQKTKKHLKLN